MGGPAWARAASDVDGASACAGYETPASPADTPSVSPTYKEAICRHCATAPPPKPPRPPAASAAACACSPPLKSTCPRFTNALDQVRGAPLGGKPPLGTVCKAPLTPPASCRASWQLEAQIAVGAAGNSVSVRTSGGSRRGRRCPCAGRLSSTRPPVVPPWPTSQQPLPHVEPQCATCTCHTPPT